ncbi:MAG: sugar ABC transporter ATP-binding protein [Devosiaceae bacterium]
MPLLKLNAISRAYGKVQALNAVSLDLHTGQMHALMGENGAGKSTLIRALAGLEPLDAGTITIEGTVLPSASPSAMQSAGLRFIHQELHPVRGLSVAENMHLDHAYPTRFGLIRWGALNAIAKSALARLGLTHIDPKAPMSALGAGDQMLVRIAATLIQDDVAREPWLYVMDEPTAALTGEESERLFTVIGELTQQGSGVLYVSHRMPEVLRLADHVSVLRDGQLISSKARKQTDQDQIIHDMTGRDLSGLFPARAAPLPATTTNRSTPSLVVKSLSAGTLQEASFSLQSGEILGIGGLSGSGRGALLRALLGDVPREAGTVLLDGRALATRPADVWTQGLAYIPRERRAEGLMMSRSVRENVALPHLTRFARAGVFLDQKRQRQVAENQGSDVRLKMTTDQQPCAELSGGNQQKVLFARALAGDPSVLMLDEPTRGVDIGARFDLYRIIRALSESGKAILLASSDLPELIGLSDRIAIMRDGVLADIISSEGLTEGALLTHFYRGDEKATAA